MWQYQRVSEYLNGGGTLGVDSLRLLSCLHSLPSTHVTIHLSLSCGCHGSGIAIYLPKCTKCIVPPRE